MTEAYQQFLDKSPSNWGEEKVVAYGTKKGYKVIGVCGHGKVDGIVLFGLDAGDKKYVGKEAKVKTGQTVFRYATRNSMAGDIFPLVKIDVKRGLLYNLSQKSNDGEVDYAEFDSKSSKLRYLRLAATANLRDITGFDPGFGSMKESVDLEEVRKPVSQMTPAEKKKDAERRKEYKAYQKSKFPTNTSATQGKRMGERESVEEGKMKEFHAMVKKGMTAAQIAKKIGMKEKDVAEFMKGMKESNELQEGKNLIPDFQKIVKTKGAAKVGGVMIDMFTASAITQAYDKVNPAMKKKMETSDVNKLVGLAQRLMGESVVAESARKDAMRDIGKRGRDSADIDNDATDDDRKAASKNVLMQIRKLSDLPKGGEIEFEGGKKGKMSQDDAKKVSKLFDILKKPQDKKNFQKIISKDLKAIQGLLKRLGR